MAIPSTKACLSLALLGANLATAQQNEVAPRANCTTTLTLTQSRLPTPPYWPQCSWDGTLSIYSSTVTVERSIDCHGCSDVRVAVTPIVHCPAMIITASVHVATPSTEHRTVCLATPTPRI
ncbi:uncharacterized protein TrAtP1_000304 [Trichoderma atroviride]|uniref:uncharacterized protein n=1 Tax=Hypocrea atroviridis TaxID=63577 RepID=UPI0033339884|nr:hypothetical protein TrAtP1_000304 [Trichoderma atroviride]